MAAKVKFALKTKILAEKLRKKNIKEINLTANKTEVREENSDNKKDDLIE